MTEQPKFDEQVLSRNDEPIHVRVYRPDAQGVLPVLVYYHGGGWVIGNIEAVDRSLRLLADEAKVVIVSVDYRLAPENPYPASWDDAEDAFVWTVDNAERLGGESSGVCVGGDSAGGTMAAVVTSRRLKAEEPGPACQLLRPTTLRARARVLLLRLYGSFRAKSEIPCRYLPHLSASEIRIARRATERSAALQPNPRGPPLGSTTS